MKNIALYEDFSQEQYLIDKIYENWESKNSNIFDLILESEGQEEISYTEDEEEIDIMNRPLSAGELRALNRDLQVISTGQLAALYLKALGLTEISTEKEGKNLSTSERIEADRYLVNIPGMEAFCNQDWRTGSYYVTYKGLADAMGIEKIATVTRTVRKFYLLITEGSGREEEVVYPKLIDAFKYFKSKGIDVIQSIAEQEIKNPEESNVHRATAIRRGISKEQTLAIGESVYKLFQDFIKNPFFKKDVCKVQKVISDRISKEKGIEAKDILNYYKEYLVKQRMLNKFNYCS